MKYNIWFGIFILLICSVCYGEVLEISTTQHYVWTNGGDWTIEFDVPQYISKENMTNIELDVNCNEKWNTVTIQIYYDENHRYSIGTISHTGNYKYLLDIDKIKYNNGHIYICICRCSPSDI